MSLADHNKGIATNEILTRSAEGTYLTIWLLSDSICKREISLRVVDGTPSSSICDKNREKMCIIRTPFLLPRVQIDGQLLTDCLHFSPQTHLQSRFFQGH